jgi:UDP-GlcNAc:undecaprenyl-phosphate GlcNAc-1-phosphate transferase
MRRGWAKPPSSHRDVHRTPVPRLGGVAIFVATMSVVAAAMFFPRVLDAPPGLHGRVAGILGPAVLIFFIGLFDDVRPLGAWVKLLGQMLAAVLLYAGGFGVYRMDLLGGNVMEVYWALPLTIFWVVLVTNAFNLIDGLDGLAPGSALFSTFVVFMVSLFFANPLISFLAVVLAGSILGFLPYNFSPASIFLGDSGSLYIGFLLSALGLAGSQKAQTMVAVAIPVICFGLPILDVGLALVRRFMNGKPLSWGDREHIHHKLLDRGLSQRKAVLLLYCVTGGFSLLSLALLHGQHLVVVILVIAGAGVCFGVQHLRYHEFSELGRVARRTLRQKQIIANNMNIRHAAESLRVCSQCAVLLQVLRETLFSLGFDGFELVPSPAIAGRPPLSPQTRRNGYDPPWSVGLTSRAAWALKLCLVTTSGESCGFFWLHRRTTKTPLLVDMDLLTGEFRIAIAEAVHRALAPAALTPIKSEPQQVRLAVHSSSS